MQEMIEKAKKLLADGTVARVLGWRRGELPYSPEPAFFTSEEELCGLVYDGFCGANFKQIYDPGREDGGKYPGILEALRYLQLQSAH